MSPIYRWGLSLLWKLIIVAIAVLTVQNWDHAWTVQVLQQPYWVYGGGLILALFVLGALTTGVWGWLNQQVLYGQVKQWELRREKAEVQAETSSDQVKALQAKIQTLEAALERALLSGQAEK